ncbi:TetR/AcrR family transcriptional regulator [Cryptosporangium aurantiacum]|uniref:Transcriptional regulator, TetR family n=1 Tax=Cryptosporangium aurantiacum TaxID=134849 RepID=A0A1M7KHG2_9ACTN|nr:TetR/AcrR family transcriptional regulator [Cryptosporangium aurantiacum]SHM64765.1 transcriptional regulator, TetR family [Cryptosporangium aurantiacum]
MKNDVLAGGVVDRIARQTRERRGGLDYAEEVRRLLAAALEVMKSCGTTSRPRVADIVATAGLSNEAFYRHFSSKEALVAALIEDGTHQLSSYLAHQMGKETTPEGRVRRWVEGVMTQTGEDIAATTLAVLWNGGSVGQGMASGRHPGATALGPLLEEPLAELGSSDPEFDAALAAHAVLGTLSDYLWKRSRPTRAELDRMTRFIIAAVHPSAVHTAKGQA